MVLLQLKTLYRVVNSLHYAKPRPCKPRRTNNSRKTMVWYQTQHHPMLIIIPRSLNLPNHWLIRLSRNNRTSLIISPPLLQRIRTHFSRYRLPLPMIYWSSAGDALSVRRQNCRWPKCCMIWVPCERTDSLSCMMSRRWSKSGMHRCARSVKWAFVNANPSSLTRYIPWWRHQKFNCLRTNRV